MAGQEPLGSIDAWPQRATDPGGWTPSAGKPSGAGRLWSEQGREEQAAGGGLTLTAGERPRPFPPSLPTGDFHWTVELSVPPRPRPANLQRHRALGR